MPEVSTFIDVVKDPEYHTATERQRQTETDRKTDRQTERNARQDKPRGSMQRGHDGAEPSRAKQSGG